MLLNSHSGKQPEAGCDEAGRGCLAGPVFAAAVILPKDFYHPLLNDSKKMNENQRTLLREVIEKEAIDFAVEKMDASEIDHFNILWASVRTMHKSLDKLKIRPDFIIIDGNKFLPYQKVNYECIVKGDGIYASIAAASILAKTYRDDYMKQIDSQYPDYNWKKNKGYPTKEHRNAIRQYGITDYHRKSFQLLPLDEQLKLF